MKPRAFVVMPFGKKRPVEVPTKDEEYQAKAVGEEIDFDAVFCQLLEPALTDAGYDAFRADSEAAAGDIRTDMFFELVTADLVVADISIANPNVFYELGVRHGVCPRGVLVVQGNFLNSRPFDVAPDRTFSYNGKLFTGSKEELKMNDGLPSEPQSEEQEKKKRLRGEIERLSQTFKHAMAGEQKTIGSPVYEHLPGLIPVNWDKIETSKAKYFGTLRDDWLDCVRIAQSQGHPGDIKTLADEAPTLAHRTKILYQAALALIDLCRYEAAERELREVIEHDPSHSDAQLQLGRVLAYQGKTDLAEHHLRNTLREHDDEPKSMDLLGQVSDVLGQVYRRLWHLAWQNEESTEKRKEKAIANSYMAAQAVENFLRAQKANPAAYFAGFNALILDSLLEDLSKKSPEIWPAKLDVPELITVVQFCAKNARERAAEKGDFVEQFWTTTTLAGIALLQSDDKRALRGIRDACSIPGATFFQLQSFQERLLLYDELDFRPEFVKPALDIVMEALKQKKSTNRRVFLWACYPIDKKTEEKARFPEASIEFVGTQIDNALDEWHVKDHDLAICEGAHEGDILFAEACRKRKVPVRLMLLPPVNGQSHQVLWPFRSEEWEGRFHKLRSDPGVDVWFHSEHLGTALDENTPNGRRSLEARHKNWLINTARLEAEPAFDPIGKGPADSGGQLYGLFLWNDESGGENVDDPSYFARLVSEFSGYRGEVKPIKIAPQAVGQKSDAMKAG